MTFARGSQTLQFWKALITYYHHAKFQGSVIYSPWEKLNVKVLVHTDTDANTDADADDGRIPTQCIST